MYQLSRDLSSETAVLDATRTAVRTIAAIFDAKVGVFLSDEQRIIDGTDSRRCEKPLPHFFNVSLARSVLEQRRKICRNFSRMETESENGSPYRSRAEVSPRLS